MTMIVSVIRSNHMHYYDSKLLTIHTVYSPEPADTLLENVESFRAVVRRVLGQRMDSRVVSRGMTLFTLGLALAIALNQLWSLALPAWLLFPLLAGAVTATGLLYPHVAGSGDAPDISEIMRCVAVFVGIFQASTKIDFSSYIELAVTMGALGVGMWWLFDRSKGGLLLSFVLTLLSSAITVVLFYCYDVRLTDAKFFYSRLWCIYFSGCITFGTIGRRLALND